MLITKTFGDNELSLVNDYPIEKGNVSFLKGFS
jgi:hypothetical protein